MAVDGGKSQQVTSFKNLPVRFLSSSDAGILCFGYDGDLYTMKPGSGRRSWLSRSPPTPRPTASACARHQRRARNGGRAERKGNRLHRPRRRVRDERRRRRDQAHHGDAGGGARLGFSPDGKAIVYASERNGRWAVYEATKARDESRTSTRPPC